MSTEDSHDLGNSGPRPQFFTKADLLGLLSDHQSDPQLARDLDQLTGDSTDDLDPL